ncbi:aldo/keto reductase [Agrilactobacillus fermenti]|uniref:aldo/keto reductase n=1 Tax=Agrilactobacillus fermenti TaxID=2586909 RepID=UPI003A5C1E5F
MKQLSVQNHKLTEIGIGTWYLGEGSQAQTNQEMAAIKAGLDQGINVVDTAEMYGNGQSETLVGQVLKDYQRTNIFLISKFLPSHATPKAMKKSLEQSLRRLQTDYLDLYLYHWRGGTPLAETLAGMQALQKAGYIKHFGVSNFDVADLKALLALPGGQDCFVNEVLYNIQSRGIEYDLLPYQKSQGIACIGYSPLGSSQGHYLDQKPILAEMAAAKHISVQQLLIAWVLRHHEVITIPRSGQKAHMLANVAAADISFTADELAQLDQYYPAPTHKQPLEII